AANHPAELGEPPDEALRIALELLEGELPAVAAAGDEALDDAERGVHELALVGDPAGELGDVREPVARQEPQHLELRVVAGLEAAEELEHERVVEHDGA